MPMANPPTHTFATITAVLLTLAPPTAMAQDRATDADVIAFAKRAGLVVRAQVSDLKGLDPAAMRTPTPGHQRYYVEAKTRALLFGSKPLGEALRYLVDLPLDQGLSSDLAGREVILFAQTVPGHPEDLKLVSPTAQVLWNPAKEARLRTVLRSRVLPNPPSNVTRVRELSYVPGNLAGQGRTQVFLDTQRGRAASITIRHEPGQAPSWGVSFSEMVAKAGQRPEHGTLEWYSLACFLPHTPPAAATTSGNYAEQMQALSDYRLVMAELGTCERSMT